MDKATEEFNKASTALVEAKVRLNTVNSQITALDKELAILTAVEIQLIQNLRVLRSKRLIVVVSEYQKALLDLKTCRSRAALMRIDKQGILKVQSRAQAEYNKTKARYEEAFDKIHNPPNNVIQGSFGKKDGKR